MDKNSLEFAEALVKVSEEFSALTGSGKDLTVKEMGEVQKYILARCDFSKPEQDLTNEEGAWKVIYDACAKQLAEVLGADKWHELEKSLIKFVRISQVREATTTFFAAIPKIEGLFSQQYGRIAFHQDQTNNEYRVQEKRLSELMLDKVLSDRTHREHAESIIKLVEQYKEGFILPLQKLNDEIQKELLHFEFMLGSLPVNTDEKFDEVAHAKGSTVFATLRRWIALSKELHTARLMASDSIARLVECDTTIPNKVIEHGGSIAFALSGEEGRKFQDELSACGTLMKESFENNERIQKEREPLTKLLVPDEKGKPEAHEAEWTTVNPSQVKPHANQVHPLQAKAWFRLIKIAYGLFGIFGFGISAAIALDENDGSFFIAGAIVVGILLVMIRKAFYYIMLGRTTPTESPGSGFADLDDVRRDFAALEAADNPAYKEIVVPYLDSLKAQYGRRIPQHALDGLRQRINHEVNAIKEKRDGIVKKAASEGANIPLAKLRENFERQKAEHQGPDREAVSRQLDLMIFKLEAKYGTAIPVDEAQKLLDEIEADLRRNQKAQGA